VILARAWGCLPHELLDLTRAEFDQMVQQLHRETRK